MPYAFENLSFADGRARNMEAIDEGRQVRRPTFIEEDNGKSQLLINNGVFFTGEPSNSNRINGEVTGLSGAAEKIRLRRADPCQAKKLSGLSAAL